MQRNYLIDTLKILCAVLIIFLHVPTPLRAYYEPLIRCGVPCFFMISGYLLYGDEMQEKTKKGIKRIFILTLWSTFLYLAYSVILHRGNLNEVIPSKQGWLDFLFLNENPWGGHLWYLSAYLYVLIVFSRMKSENLRNLIFSIIPLLLLADLTFGFYSNALWGKVFPICYVRNFLCVGLPYFSIGCILRKKFISCKSTNLVLGGVVFFLTSFIEKKWIFSIGLNGIREHYLSTTFLSICLFLLFVNNKQKTETIISRMGKELSLYVYIFHPIIRDVCEVFITHTCDEKTISVYIYIAPIVVLVIVTMFSHVLNEFMKLLKTRER